MSGFETLLSPSGILVYGRVMQDIQIVATNYDAGAQQAGAPPRRGDNRFLQDQLQADGARFARIYAYAYEGCIYDLLRPVLLLVHGEPAEIYGQPADADNVGVATHHGHYTDDMRVWAYDKGDFTVCMEVDTGTFDEMILQTEAAEAEMAFASGATARGATARGATARGATARGATARGATARGATARGATARGATARGSGD